MESAATDYRVTATDPVALVDEPELRRFCSDTLAALGASDDETQVVTDGLVTASLWWHPGQGQGIEKFFRYYRRVKNGGIIPGAKMTWVRRGTSSALLDAAKGFGYLAASVAMDRAIEMALTTGIGAVGVQHSNHFGIAGYHAVHAAREGLIGIAMTNAKAEMAPWGAAKPVLGTNPWGIAVPRLKANPIVLDMALTMSGKGMIGWYRRAGRPIPISWALTSDGRTTTDPAEAADGPLLPIGEYKGYGLSAITDILAGVMTGALFGLSVFQDDTNFDVGHFVIAVDPDAFIGRDNFYSRLERLLEEVQASTPIDPDRPVELPGERQFRNAEYRREHGIPLSVQTLDRLRPLIADLGVEPPRLRPSSR